MTGFPILSTILLSPIAGALLLFFIPGEKDRMIKISSLFFAGISLVLSCYAYFILYTGNAGNGFAETIPWVNSLGVNYALGVDGLSMPLVLLTSIILFCGVLVTWKLDYRPKEFFFYMLILAGGVFGVFISRNLFFLFLFLEIALLPKFILITIWGSTRKEYAAMKYTLYLLSGSAVVLITLIAIYQYAADPLKGLGFYTFDMDQLASVHFDLAFQKFAFFLMLIGFGILVPIWPLHRWTPDGHSAAPTAISMVLAGVIMKLGGYAIIRIGIGFFPEGALFWAPYIAVFATINVVYTALVAMVQKDIKFVVANSSISHMGYVLIGIASLNTVSIAGASAQMFAHGIMAALLFALVGNIYDKAHTRMIEDFGGLAHQMPKTASAFLIGGLASLGLPGTLNFVSEFTIFAGAMQVFPVLSVISIFAVVITAIYVLIVVQKVFFGPRKPGWDKLGDIKGFEMVPIVILCGFLLVFGFFPDLIMRLINDGVQVFIRN